jgi:hypothetical protein
MPAGNFARDNLVNGDNLEALLFVGLFFWIYLCSHALKNATAVRQFLLSELLYHTYFILLSFG